jgi:uncharacterized membrane protein YphA (DoxX/SURF4 family)
MWRDELRSIACVFLRLGLGTLFVYHGAMKLTRDWGTTWSESLPTEVQATVAWAELGCAVLLCIGLLSRLAALGLGLLQGGAIYFFTGERGFVRDDLISLGAHGMHGFNFVNIGYEYNFAIIIMCLALICLGSGKYSVDHMIFCRMKGQGPARAA